MNANNVACNAYGDELFDLENSFLNWQENVIEKLQTELNYSVNKSDNDLKGRIYDLQLIPTNFCLRIFKNLVYKLFDIQSIPW